MKNFIFLLFIGFILIRCDAQKPGSELIKGIYGDPRVLLNKGYSLNELGINSIFVHKASITPELIKLAHQQNIKVYAEFPLLNGKEYLTQHPEAWPIDANGNRSPQADWFMGICPSNPDFRKYREEQLISLLATLQVDGVWLDYVHWHAQFETPDPILPETCFCEYCLNDFAASKQLTLPEGGTPVKATWILKEHDNQWRKWRADVITRWVSDFKKLVHDYHPDLKLGVYYCPWYPEDFNQAAYRILGLDMAQLYKVADVLSPMLYHGRMERNLTWVGEYLDWFQRTIVEANGQGAAIWPIVQASDEPVRVPPQDFRNVMIQGVTPPSSGIMMFSTWAFEKDSVKIKVMKDLYTKGFK